MLNEIVSVGGGHLSQMLTLATPFEKTEMQKIVRFDDLTDNDILGIIPNWFIALLDLFDVTNIRASGTLADPESRILTADS